MKFIKMGNCMKSKGAKRQIVLSIFGLDAAGKTTAATLIKGASNELSTITPTLGFLPHEFTYNSNEIMINDLGGGEKFRELWKHYMAESYGFIFVIDSSDRKRMKECQKEFQKFIENRRAHGKPILILANKQDVQNALEENEIIETLNLEDLVNKYETPCRVELCSTKLLRKSKMDESIKTGFDWLIKHIETEYEKLKERVDREYEEQKKQEEKEKQEKLQKVKDRRDLAEKKTTKPLSNDSDSTDYFQTRKESPKHNKENKELKENESSLNSLLYDFKKNDIRNTSSPRAGNRLNSIEEETAKPKNKFFKSNKLSPSLEELDEDIIVDSKKKPDWAITSYDKKRSQSPPY